MFRWWNIGGKENARRILGVVFIKHLLTQPPKTLEYGFILFPLEIKVEWCVVSNTYNTLE